jgi:hypothetical protein
MLPQILGQALDAAALAGLGDEQITARRSASAASVT